LSISALKLANAPYDPTPEFWPLAYRLSQYFSLPENLGFGSSRVVTRQYIRRSKPPSTGIRRMSSFMFFVSPNGCGGDAFAGVAVHPRSRRATDASTPASNALV
jgi:hypothetical protein